MRASLIFLIPWGIDKDQTAREGSLVLHWELRRKLLSEETFKDVFSAD